MSAHVPPEIANRLDGDLDDLRAFADELARVDAGLPRHISLDQSNVEQGLARLVLTLIELLRQLLERQALRRIEGGSLSDEQIERLGETFMKLDARMSELKRTFRLSDDDLNLNLGPLGDLM